MISQQISVIQTSRANEDLFPSFVEKKNFSLNFHLTPSCSISQNFVFFKHILGQVDITRHPLKLFIWCSFLFSFFFDSIAMGKGQGSDLYAFKCTARDGCVVKLDFQSYQYQEVPEEHGFWASMFVDSDIGGYNISFEGGFRYIPSCELTRYYAAKLPSVEVSVTNVKDSAKDEVTKILKSFGACGAYGTSGNACSISYNSPVSANAAIVALDGGKKELSEDGSGLKVGPEVMPPSIYDYSDEELASGVIEGVEIFDAKEVEEGDWVAKVVVKFCEEKFCEHVKVGAVWNGR